MKKFLALLLTLVMALTICGCDQVKQAADNLKSEIDGAIDGYISEVKDEFNDAQSQIDDAIKDEISDAESAIDSAVSDVKDEFDNAQSQIESEIKDEISDAESAIDDAISDIKDEIPDYTSDTESEEEPAIDKDGTYTKKDDVALYIHTYGCLPDNFISKKEAQKLGWSGGSLEPYAPGMCIGGSYFGNYEGLLPEKDGRTYTECDIDTLGKSSRGAKRIVFSNDGLIFYTDDHYESFTQLY